jgi:mRNA interferase RelE/StbE
MYQVKILQKTVKEIAAIPRDYASLVSKQIDSLQKNPRPPNVRKLSGTESYRLRVGTYRILYDISDESRTVTVYRVKHRREVYRH